ncbi:GNAT family N-acetyltransferase [Streptomyces sp. CB01635]|uniref:GNAT family N-acetyltransferase n=2 Tax=unclassified Streptomyces TaxID=2593676 RepID=UPI001F1F2004|nr:GNAT family N-acetyltransferase [Streptomyces sp. CB01635]
MTTHSTEHRTAAEKMTDIGLVPWTDDDFDLLLKNNAPEMTAHLGGPETLDQLMDRHRRYLALSTLDGHGRMFRITAGPDAPAAGSIGYWATPWQGERVWETGWGVLPGYQGRGIAAAAARLVAAHAAADRARLRHLHAFPPVDHPASNGVCRSAGFTLRGPCDLEYPKGCAIRCHDWHLDLRTLSRASS